jgi:hypothetical protein
MPASGSFCLRLVKAISSCPVLVVKVNSKGPYLKSDNLAMGGRPGRRRRRRAAWGVWGEGQCRPA